MTVTTLEQEVLDELRRMSPSKQREALEAVRRINIHPEGEPGWKIIQHARAINFPLEDLEEMERAIEEACEEIEDDPEVNFDE
jgi:hypothetical protein